jgi:hypothetical protein
LGQADHIVLGLFTAYLVDSLTPSSSATQTTPTASDTKARLSPELDENGARRGEANQSKAAEGRVE